MASFPEHFERQYQSHLKHLKLKGQQPKTIDAYARGMRRFGAYFSYQVDALSIEQLTDYFTDLMASHSWSSVKLVLYGFKFFTEHVLRQPWAMPNFTRPPEVSRLLDIVSVAEAQALTVGDIDAARACGSPRRRTQRFGLEAATGLMPIAGTGRLASFRRAIGCGAMTMRNCTGAPGGAVGSGAAAVASLSSAASWQRDQHQGPGTCLSAAGAAPHSSR